MLGFPSRRPEGDIHDLIEVWIDAQSIEVQFWGKVGQIPRFHDVRTRHRGIEANPHKVEALLALTEP